MPSMDFAPDPSTPDSQPLNLPPELWEHVLSLVPPSSLQQTAASLSRAIPSAQISPSHVYRHVRITSAEQLKLLQTTLSRIKNGTDERAKGFPSLTRSWSLMAWKCDPDLMNVVVEDMKYLNRIHCNVGPMFAPEHLEDLFTQQRDGLESITLRFNQYVKKKTYYSFLKGAYFDSALETLARWPESPKLKSLSFVQDIAPTYAPSVSEPSDSKAFASAIPEHFAQPIVFFKTFCISTLSSSPAAKHVENLRLRIPNRSVLASLTSPATSTTSLPSSAMITLHMPKPFPSLKLLDISTTYVPLGPAFAGLLKRYHSLHHLILDRTGLVPGSPALGRKAKSQASTWSGEWESAIEAVKTLGRVSAMVGVTRATEAHRIWRAWIRDRETRQRLEAARVRTLQTSTGDKGHPEAGGSGSGSGSQPVPKRRGRSGFASESRPVKKRNDVSISAAVIPEEGTSTSTAGAGGTDETPPPPPPSSLPSKVLVIPHPPCLKTVSYGIDGLTAEQREEWVGHFESGWREGVGRVVEGVEEAVADWERETELKRRKGVDESGIVLVRFLTPEEEGDKRRDDRDRDSASRGSSSSDVFSAFMENMSLVRSDPSEAWDMLARAKTSECVFCTVPDCANVGGVAWSDTDANGMVVGGGKGVENSGLDLDERRPLGEHSVGCGHRVGREVWEADRD